MAVVSLLALCLGCGATTQGGSNVDRPVTVDPVSFLRELAAESSDVMRPAERSPEEIDAARREARGAERLALTRDLVAAYVQAWEAAEERRERRRLRRRADRFADAGIRGSRDPSMDAQLDFAKLWMSWVGEERSAGRRAERFTRRYAQTGGSLTGVAWMIRGEVALQDEDWDEAREAFRFALGQVGTPLYAYALLRTGAAHRGAGDGEEAEQAMNEALQMGCDTEAPPLVVRVAGAAASALGTGLRRDPDGTIRPAACPSHAELEAEEEPEGWRPAE